MEYKQIRNQQSYNNGYFIHILKRMQPALVQI